LSSFKSIREFADDINSTESKIDVFIQNAGYASTFDKKKSVDGIEMTMATNHFGPFLLTHLLIDLLKKSSPSRIVIVASECYRFTSVNLKNLNPLDSMPGMLYYVSKGVNVMWALELARRLKGTNVTVNSLHPGMIDSGIWRNVPFPLTIFMWFIKQFFKTTQEGAQTSLYLACSEDVKNISGKYYLDCKEWDLQPYITDPEKHKILWEESLKMVKMTDADPKI
jgi:retinol dehydrogenase 14